jgi:hypothetical protein
MNKPFRGLGKIIRILQPPKGQAGSGSFQRPMEAREEGEIQALLARLSTLEPGLKLLDTKFPIREGSACIDFLASNASGELILVWVLDRLGEDRIVRLIPEYDWAKKNSLLWQHLFPSLQSGKTLKIHVWWLARDVDSAVKSMLSYLKDIPLKIFRFQWAKKGEVRVGAWEEDRPERVKSSQKSTWSPGEGKPSSSAVHPPLPSTALNSEEIKDLLAEAPPDTVNYEDEITDPYCPISELE